MNEDEKRRNEKRRLSARAILEGQEKTNELLEKMQEKINILDEQRENHLPPDLEEEL